ncbi:GNAT family N-acetyltransferase [Telluribacter sp. SYSU D00476]|uniref:GNAT family N-acetyltransferase n=1 Tax=Telluribacter sp. SYSU D00476 TaxID=2811430 RepID=UPI001FF1E558|nr:GNAT family N-acetyltransferase [Telluribacter sp. SYSU D00476]
MQLTWSLKPFYSLTLDELYQFLRLRSEVFVVEQTCPFLDIDNKDQPCHHLMGWTPEGELAAYTRLVPPGLSYEEVSIGRVVSSPQYRRYGIGRELMQKSIESIGQLYGQVPIRIGAQLYLKKFYESFGFEQVGEMYLEDDIEHIQMLLKVG